MTITTVVFIIVVNVSTCKRVSKVDLTLRHQEECLPGSVFLKSLASNLLIFRVNDDFVLWLAMDVVRTRWSGCLVGRRNRFGHSVASSIVVVLLNCRNSSRRQAKSEARLLDFVFQRKGWSANGTCDDLAITWSENGLANELLAMSDCRADWAALGLRDGARHLLSCTSQTLSSSGFVDTAFLGRNSGCDCGVDVHWLLFDSDVDFHWRLLDSDIDFHWLLLDSNVNGALPHARRTGRSRVSRSNTSNGTESDIPGMDPCGLRPGVFVVLCTTVCDGRLTHARRDRYISTSTSSTNNSIELNIEGADCCHLHPSVFVVLRTTVCIECPTVHGDELWAQLFVGTSDMDCIAQRIVTLLSS